MLPPPVQTWAANLMLNVLEACVPTWSPGRTLASLGRRDPMYGHMLVEAKKLAYTDLFAHNADPEFKPPPIDRLHSPEYVKSLCARASADRASVMAAPVRSATPPGDTRSYCRRLIGSCRPRASRKCS